MPDPTVTVCARCLTAACWQGESMCDEAVHAGVVAMDIDVLQAMGREHPSWWLICPDHSVAYRACHCVPREIVQRILEEKE